MIVSGRRTEHKIADKNTYLQSSQKYRSEVYVKQLRKLIELLFLNKS